MLVIAKPGFEEAGPFSSSAAVCSDSDGLIFVGLPAEWLNFQPFLEQSCSKPYLWWSRGTANTSGYGTEISWELKASHILLYSPGLACCQGQGFICSLLTPAKRVKIEAKDEAEAVNINEYVNMLICLPWLGNQGNILESRVLFVIHWRG